MSNLEYVNRLPSSSRSSNDPSLDTVAALAIGQRAGQTMVFIGTRAGVYAAPVSQPDHAAWQKLPHAPTEILALAVSPTYAEDTTILAGTGYGLFISYDGGAQWLAVHTPMPNSVILCLCFSPNYRADGIILAGTLEDGIYYSNDRGERWSYRGFGLLDATVYALAISPNFAQDELLFAGTETALYYSYNGARAWKPLPFPEETAPILSLALSSHFAQDQTIYAGTEQHGLYRSHDLSNHWQRLDLPATCINALAVAPTDGRLFAATNGGLYGADRAEKDWRCLLDQPDAFSLAVSDERLIVGLIEQGAWQSSNTLNWTHFFTKPL